jgi:hypothetical protein
VTYRSADRQRRVQGTDDFAKNSLSPIGVLMMNYSPAFAGASRVVPLAELQAAGPVR